MAWAASVTWRARSPRVPGASSRRPRRPRRSRRPPRCPGTRWGPRSRRHPRWLPGLRPRSRAGGPGPGPGPARPGWSWSCRSAGPGRRPAPGCAARRAARPRSRGRARRRATGSPRRPRGSAPCCPAGTRGAARSPGIRTRWPPRPPRRPGRPAPRPTASTARAAPIRPGRRCRAAARPAPGCTCPCRDPAPPGRGTPGCAAARAPSAWPARLVRRSRSPPAAASPTPAPPGSAPRAALTGSCRLFSHTEHCSGRGPPRPTPAPDRAGRPRTLREPRRAGRRWAGNPAPDLRVHQAVRRSVTFAFHDRESQPSLLTGHGARFMFHETAFGDVKHVKQYRTPEEVRSPGPRGCWARPDQSWPRGFGARGPYRMHNEQEGLGG